MTMMDQDDLDRALRSLARPATTITPAIEDELAKLTITTMREATSSSTSPPWRFAVAGVLSVGAIVGVGAAAVATGLWAPWAQTPDGSFTYVLPSGVTCEERVGDLYADNPDVRSAVQDIFATTDVVAVSDVAGSVAELEADDATVAYAEAALAAGDVHGMTTTADVIYSMAVSNAVSETVQEQLAARGFDMSEEQNLISFQGQALCGQDIQ